MPVKRQRIHPLLNQYCANLSTVRLPERPPPPSRSLISARRITPPPVSLSTEPDMPPKKSIVYSLPHPPSLSICVQILNHVGVGENESGKGLTRRCRKRERNGKRSECRDGGFNRERGTGENWRGRRKVGTDRQRSLSIADEFNGVAFRCIPVELTARGPSKSIRENLFGAVWSDFLSS